MAHDLSKYTTGPSEQELRMRAAHRVARRRSFTTSLVVVGSLIVLNLFFYAQSHNATWLMLDAVFACTLAYRAWSRSARTTRTTSAPAADGADAPFGRTDALAAATASDRSTSSSQLRRFQLEPLTA